jgi:hypothetical protein
MSSDRDVTRIVRSWLEEGASALPDRVLDAVLDQVPATSQRRPWWPAPRLATIRPAFRAALGAAAVLTVAIVGVGLWAGGQAVVGPVSTPTPTPRSSGTPLASPLLQGPPYVPASGLMTAGRYRLGRITFTVPEGWTAFQEWAVLHGDYAAAPPDGAGFVRWRIGSVYADPCHWSKSPTISTGSTVDGVVNAFKAQDRGGQVVTPMDTVVDGYRGLLIDLIVPTDVDFANCDQGEYHSWISANEGDRYNQGPGQHDVLRIVDVGGSIEAILTDYSVATSAAVRTELQAMVDSVVFDTPTSPSPSTSP